jgi:polysaccharide biosynthesis transport protein
VDAAAFEANPNTIDRRTATMPKMAMSRLTTPDLAAAMSETPATPGAARMVTDAPALAPSQTPVDESAVPLEAVAELAQELAGAGAAGRRIAVMGTHRNAGTTLTAIALARLLAGQGRVVLVDLALAAPNLSVIAADASAPGIAELAQGSASFGQVITRDRFSGIHLVTAGRPVADVHAALASQRLSIGLEALARCYDFVVIDAGALPEVAAARIARLAPWAVVIAAGNDAGAAAARQQLAAAGFARTSVLTAVPEPAAAEAAKAARTRAAA